jgi:hypothetical protein
MIMDSKRIQILSNVDAVTEAYNRAISDGAVVDDARFKYLSDHQHFTYPSNGLKTPHADLMLTQPLFIAAAKASRSV